MNKIKTDKIFLLIKNLKKWETTYKNSQVFSKKKKRRPMHLILKKWLSSRFCRINVYLICVALKTGLMLAISLNNKSDLFSSVSYPYSM